jgi:hypothetical protein
VQIRDLAENLHIVPVTQKMDNVRRMKFGGGFLAGFQQFSLPGEQYPQLRYGAPQCGDQPQEQGMVFAGDKFRRVQKDKIPSVKPEGFTDPAFFLWRNRVKTPGIHANAVNMKQLPTS